MAKKETPVDEVTKLYQMGLSDSDVIKRLTQEGYSPVEISDALNQAKIKQEIELSDIKPLTPPPFVAKSYASEPAKESYQEPPRRSSAADIPVPRPSAVPPVPVPPTKAKSPGQAARLMQQQPMEDQQVAYPAYPYQYPTYQEEQRPAQQVDTEAIEEIAEEIVNEKWQEVKGKISDVIEWKNYADRRINSIDERIKRLESSIDRLQAALLSKVNEYGQEVKNLGSEMSSLEGAFGKILSPLVDNVKELGRINAELKTSSSESSAKKKTFPKRTLQ